MLVMVENVWLSVIVYKINGRVGIITFINLGIEVPSIVLLVVNDL